MQEPIQPINTTNLAYVESLYADYVRDAGSVPEEWATYFASLDDSAGFAQNPLLEPSFERRSVFNPGGASGQAQAQSPDPRGNGHPSISTKDAQDAANLQDRLIQLVRAYRVRGHLVASVDPLGLPRPPQPELFPAFFGFTDKDMDLKFSGDSIHALEPMTLREIVERLRRTYCGSIGVQYMHIDDLVMKQWLEERMEITENRIMLTHGQQIRTLSTLTDAVMLEEFIQRKFLGAKSFSLEGSESMIPLLHQTIETAGENGIDEIVLAMAHRGRLNVLVNIMGKSPVDIFKEFADDNPEEHLGKGDVKYHKGFSSDWVTSSNKEVHLTLCFNPSHLEYVNPVALGRLRAKQDRATDKDRKRKLAIVIHGDAAFAGEGIVQEQLNLSELTGYKTGGTLHIIINNQIGFTTDPRDHRSSTYATDVAKMLQIPIFHVNGENPDAVAQVVRLSTEFRRTFEKDVVIDMYSYRRRGHNEGDEPAFTQPLMYRAIRARSNVREGYLKNLLRPDGVTQDDADRIAEERKLELERSLAEAKEKTKKVTDATMGGLWQGYRGGRDSDTPDAATGIGRDRLAYLLEMQTHLPDTFTPHPKLTRLLGQRRKMARGERPLDWGAAESLAFATLLTEGTRIRMTGQDSQRGTFSHRHAVLHDNNDGSNYMPLQHLDHEQASIEIHNSPLCESAVLGFEYGYSLDMPDALVIWEAQFGDFANVAQPIIDQFIVSGEEKWQRLSGLVMLLPHAMEGMGPEHSSARLERYLAMAAEDNVQICVPTTPAQCFHMFRRQVQRKWRKPLIVMSPKSLLRHPKAVSSLEDLEKGQFQRIMPDSNPQRTGVTRVLWCTGKIYYELEQKREELGREDVAIVRIEQLYPLPDSYVLDVMSSYDDGTECVFVQDEPENMGAWRHMRARFGDTILERWPLRGVTRRASSSPATGSAAAHKIEQARLLDRAFA